MSALVLDTHAALWMVDGQLRAKASARVAEAASARSLFLCTISAWEIAMLVEKGRIRLTRETEAYVRDLFLRPGLTTALLTADIGARAGSLSGFTTGDPADRIIAATAMVYGAELMTRDDAMHAYAKRTKALRCVRC